MKISLRRVDVLAFEASNGRGDVVFVAGSDEMAARVHERVRAPVPSSPTSTSTGSGMRPMELMLVSLASCGAMDIVVILTRQREPLGELTIEAVGTRRDALPSIFVDITLRVVAPGVNLQKLRRAAELSVQKYCSVRSMLGPDTSVQILVENTPE